MPGRNRPVEDDPDALTHPSSGLGFGQPDGSKDAQDLGRLDLPDRHRANHGEGIGAQGRHPLPPMLRVAPQIGALLMNCLGCSFER